jgi:nucleoid-associated protein Lsr2
MARKITEMIISDLNPEKELPADETVSFALDGIGYEIDLTDADAGRLRNAMFEFVDAARPVSRHQRGGSPGRKGKRDSAARHHSAAVRAWAQENGIPVSALGRIPVDVLQQYDAAH